MLLLTGFMINLRTMKNLLSFDDARQILFENAKPLPPVESDLESACGMRLYVSVESDVDFPHWDVSAMDGYAVRHADLSNGETLDVVMTINAGDKPAELEPGRAARIFTGAVVPAGADTVIEQERALTSGGGRVKLEVLPKGSNLRKQGEVLSKGDTIADRGEVVTPWMVAALAAGGVRRLSMIPRPKIALITTGSELVNTATKPVPGAVRDSNSPMLRALVRESGFSLTSHATVADDLDELVDAIQAAAQDADVILTSGGVSVGDRDYVPAAVAKAGGDILFHRIAMKPGKPLLAARINRTWVMGLPGNPVSVLTGWRLFAKPLCYTLAGDLNALAEQPLTGIAGSPALNKDKRTLFLVAQVKYQGERTIISPLNWKGSHDLLSMSRAHALAVVEAGQRIDQGESIPYYLL